jgi:hypothetical protein
MKSTIETGQYGMAEISEQEALATQGGVNIFDVVGMLIGLTVSAIANDLERISNGQPVTMPAGQKAMYSALG